jgi:hypothetical protein
MVLSPVVRAVSTWVVSALIEGVCPDMPVFSSRFSAEQASTTTIPITATQRFIIRSPV